VEDKLKQEIASLVAEIFEGKKEEEHRAKTKKALETAASSIEDLTSKVSKNEETISSLESEKAELEVQVVSAKEESGKEVEALKAELDSVKEEAATSKSDLETVSAELANMKQEAVAKTRIQELEIAGVLRSDVEAQTEKVKGMSDEEFASYQEELVSIRKSILDQLEAAKKAEEVKKPEEKKEKAKTVDEKETVSKKGEGDEFTTPPVEVSPGKAIAAAMNFEIQPSEDIIAQYKAMGAAMAENMKEKSK